MTSGRSDEAIKEARVRLMAKWRYLYQAKEKNMTRKGIWILTSIMCFAMIGLIIVQKYWIDQAVKLNEQQFSQLVNTAMNDMVNEIEKQQTVFYIQEHLETGHSPAGNTEGGGDPAAASKSLKDTQIQKFIDSIRIVRMQSILKEKGSEAESRAVHEFESSLMDNLEEKREFIDKLINQLYRADVELPHRISEPEIRTIIDQVLDNYDIRLDYEYAIAGQNGKPIYRSAGYPENEQAHVHVTTLFPDNLFSPSNMLKLYFPDEKQHLYSSLGYMSVSSILLTIIIIITFTVTLYIILQQKKFSEIKNDFVNNMTHELKTPISTISLASQMLKDKSIPPEKKDLEYISTLVEDESRRLSLQVEKVLQVAVFEKGKVQLKLKKVNVHALIENVIRTFEIHLKSRNGIIIKQLRSEWPWHRIDELHFTNVIYNLLDNAVKYSPDKPEIIIRTSGQSPFIISVSDNGTGISAENAARIFDKFYRVPTGNVHDVKGYGLGLTYVKKMVEAHHGSIHVESEEGHGSSFVIKLYDEPEPSK